MPSPPDGIFLMPRTQKRTPGRSVPAPLLPPPTELELRLEARLHEAFADLYRKRRSRVYPPWVCRFAAECLRWLPPALVADAHEHPLEYLAGVQAGVARAGMEQILKMPAKQIERLNQWYRTELPPVLRSDPNYTAGVERALQRIDVRAVPAIVNREIARKTSLTAAAYAAFAAGLSFGLKAWKNLEMLETHLKSVVRAGERADRSVVRRFLWLHWPEVERAKSRREVFEICKSSFAAISDTHSVGSWSAFEKFCQREGIRARFGPIRKAK